MGHAESQRTVTDRHWTLTIHLVGHNSWQSVGCDQSSEVLMVRAVLLSSSIDHPAHSQRIASIDAMRGLVVLVWMLSEIGVPVLYRLPSNPITDAITAQLSPSFWDGTTIRDLLLPLFCFIAGASLVPAFRRRRETGQSNGDLALRIARRAALLFAIGILCEGRLFEYWPSLRLVGAFQRIAICYVLVASLELFTGWRLQAGLAAFLLFDYWMILAFARAESSSPFSPDGNVAAAIDSAILPGRKYFATWDPEGILTTIPAVAVTIGGLLAGKTLSTDRPSRGRINLWFFGLGIAACDLALLWDIVLPINSYLWTPSFCLVAIAAGLILLGVLHAVLGARGIASWTKTVAIPLVAVGRNAIFVVLATRALEGAIGMLATRLSLVQTLFPEGAASLDSGILIAIVVITAALWLNRQRTYMTV